MMTQPDERRPSRRQMLEAEYLPNPYPLYHQLREADPVFWDEEEGH
jgi:hypothetical protein